MEWRKVSASISYCINKDILGEKLLKYNLVLLDYYIDMALELQENVYYYLDKKTYELVPLSDSDMDMIKITFLERIKKRKLSMLMRLKILESKSL